MKVILLLSLTILLSSCGDSHIVNDPRGSFQPISVSCQMLFRSEHLCLKYEWELMPTDAAVGSMILTFTDEVHPDRQVSPVSEPFVVLWMTSMGHGSSPVTVEPIGPGKYRVKDVFFIMPGPWDLKFQLRDGIRVIEEVTQSIEI